MARKTRKDHLGSTNREALPLEVHRLSAQVQVGKDECAAFVTLFRACTKDKDLCKGIKLHLDVVRKGLIGKCSDALVTMYAKCGALAQARELFDMHKSKDLFTWTSLIAGYTQKGQSQDALRCFEQMQQEGLSPDAVTYACILQACGSIKAICKGEEVHNEIVKQRLLGNNVGLCNALVNMYAKCGAFTKARQLLDELPVRDVISWSALIAGYVEHNECQQALNCFERMQEDGLCPNIVTFICILKACGSIRAFRKGEEIHIEIDKQGLLEQDVMLGSTLVDMYAKCGALAKARRVLDELPTRNAVSWTALILGYVEHGEGQQALNCFERMKCEGLCPDAVTFIGILKACGNVKEIGCGEEIHDEIAKQGLLRDDIALGTALVDMYAKCGALIKARHVLEDLPFRNIVSWNALLAGYAEHGKSKQLLDCFEKMLSEDLSPDAVTFTYIMKACGSIGAVDKGEKYHDEIAKEGYLSSNIVLGNAVVEMYANCGALEKARRVLEELPVCNVTTWNVMIIGYAEKGEGEQAWNCFEEMQREGVFPDVTTYTFILKACGSVGAVDKGGRLHDEIAKQGFLGNHSVLGNALVNMYAKCGVFAKAGKMLLELPSRDIIAWNSLIAGYAEHCEGEQALGCFDRMRREGIIPEAVTFICVLKACGNIGAADKGCEIHDEVSKGGLLCNDIVLGTSLVDMYAKCRALDKARQVLEELPIRNAISWTVLLAGYAEHGEAWQAFECFLRMHQEGFSPNSATYACVLSACTRLGLFEDAQLYFMHMSREHSMQPELEHYTCMIDLFARAGHFETAVAVTEKLPSSDSAVWSVLLTACRKWGDVRVAKWAFERAIQVDKSDAGVYVLMADIYAAAGMNNDAKKTELMRIENKAWKMRKQRCTSSFDTVV